MTGADDLATLRLYIAVRPHEQKVAHAFDRVEAEIARLEERANFADAYAYRQRDEAAEAEVERLRAELERRAGV